MPKFPLPLTSSNVPSPSGSGATAVTATVAIAVDPTAYGSFVSSPTSTAVTASVAVPGPSPPTVIEASGTSDAELDVPARVRHAHDDAIVGPVDARAHGVPGRPGPVE